MPPAPAVRQRTLSASEKVATLLMTMSQDTAATVMKHFNPDDLKTVSHAMAELRPVPLSRSRRWSTSSSTSSASAPR